MSDPMRSSPMNLLGSGFRRWRRQRLETYMRQPGGECLPKQYVTIVGTRSTKRLLRCRPEGDPS